MYMFSSLKNPEAHFLSSLFQCGCVARAHGQKIEQQRDVSVDPGSVSCHTQPRPNEHD